MGCLQSKLVTLHTEATDYADSGIRQIGLLSEFLAGKNIGNMHLDKR